MRLVVDYELKARTRVSKFTMTSMRANTIDMIETMDDAMDASSTTVLKIDSCGMVLLVPRIHTEKWPVPS